MSTIKFNPNNKTRLKVEESLGPAMKITDLKEAQEYLDAYIEYLSVVAKDHLKRNNQSAKSLALSNLGYYSGYYSNEVAERVQKLFNCKHPVLGKL